MIKLLADQQAALSASCSGFDKGDDWEAPRLANVVFTLVHDGGQIVSLLTQLGLRASLRFISSGRLDENPNIISSSPPLVMATFDQKGARFAPILDHLRSQKIALQFERWWAKELIYRVGGPGTASLTRRRLVFAMRHQDGGGHVGVLTDSTYVKLKEGGGWYAGMGSDPPKPMDMALATTMRQIAWELTETLNGLGEIT